MCPYHACEGNVTSGAVDWSAIRRQRPNYPGTPWMAVQYPYEVSAASVPGVPS